MADPEQDLSLPSAILDDGPETPLPLPLVDAREQDLFERVAEKVNKDFIRAFLIEFKPQFPEDIHLEASLGELVGQIKDAVTLGRIPRERVLKLLQEFEENGNQTLLYYLPVSDEISATCRDANGIAERLFGASWREEFPKLTRLNNGYSVVDFRIGVPGKPNDWILKIYTYQENRVPVRELRLSPEQSSQLGLEANEFVVAYKKKVTESVCLARWNDHPDLPLLELRIELSGRIKRFTIDVNAIWSRLQGVLKRDIDFSPWELEEPLERLLRDCRSHPELYEIGLTHLTDSGEGGVKYVPYTENEKIDSTPIRHQTITQILDDGGRCSRLVVTWLADSSGGALDKNLRTYAGARQSNELVVQAQTTARAVDYVTDQLRAFAG